MNIIRQPYLQDVASLMSHMVHCCSRVLWCLCQHAVCVCLQVHHLENTGSALAEDVIQKSEIIKNYIMETKSGEELMLMKSSALFDC